MNVFRPSFHSLILSISLLLSLFLFDSVLFCSGSQFCSFSTHSFDSFHRTKVSFLSLSLIFTKKNCLFQISVMKRPENGMGRIWGRKKLRQWRMREKGKKRKRGSKNFSSTKTRHVINEVNHLNRKGKEGMKKEMSYYNEIQFILSFIFLSLFSPIPRFSVILKTRIIFLYSLSLSSSFSLFLHPY